MVRKSYQESDSLISTVTTKVKGFAFTNTSEARLWDVADYVIPPQVCIRPPEEHARLLSRCHLSFSSLRREPIRSLC